MGGKTTAGKGRRRGQKQTVTVADVARHSGLSPMTVSRVVNQNSNVQVGTRERVERAIAELGYVPNVAARSLAGSGPMRIVLLYSNPSSSWLSEVLVGSLAGASDAHAQLVVEHRDDNESPAALAARLVRQRVNGVLLPAPLCDDPNIVMALRSQTMPFAQVASGSPADDGISVAICDEEAAFAMTRYLIALGHRRIGFIRGAANQTASPLREAGYLRALTGSGLEPDAALRVHGDFTYKSGLSAAAQLLDLAQPPTAIFASNDDMAAAVIAVAHRRSLNIPADLSVCGFDDSAIALCVWPELTTVRQPIASMAKTAIAELAACNSPRSIIQNHELIVRASSGSVAV